MRSLYCNSNASVNTAIGNYALHNNTTGTREHRLGDNAVNCTNTASNVICIGAGVGGLNVNNSCYIGEHLWPRGPGG